MQTEYVTDLNRWLGSFGCSLWSIIVCSGASIFGPSWNYLLYLLPCITGLMAYYDDLFLR